VHGLGNLMKRVAVAMAMLFFVGFATAAFAQEADEPTAVQPESPSPSAEEAPTPPLAPEGPSARLLWARTQFRIDFLPEGFQLTGEADALEGLGLQFLPGQSNPGLLDRKTIQSMAKGIGEDHSKIVGVYACIMENEESPEDRIHYYSIQFVPGLEMTSIADSIRKNIKNAHVVHRGEILVFIYPTDNVSFYSYLWVLRALRWALDVKYIIQKPSEAQEIEKVEYQPAFLPPGFYGRDVTPDISNFFGTPQNPSYVPRNRFDSLAESFGVDAKDIVTGYVCLILPPEPTQEDFAAFLGYIAVEFRDSETTEKAAASARAHFSGGSKQFVIGNNLLVAVMSQQVGAAYDNGVEHMHKAITLALKAKTQ